MIILQSLEPFYNYNTQLKIYARYAQENTYNKNIIINLKDKTCNKMIAYSKRAPKTKKMQQMTHDCIAFNPSAFGEFVVVVLNMFT